MKKTCTNSTCRRSFNILSPEQGNEPVRCPYCGKSYPNLRLKRKKQPKRTAKRDVVLTSTHCEEKVQEKPASSTGKHEVTVKPGENDWLMNSLKKITIEEMDLSVRAFICLKRANINKVEDLIELTQEELRKIRNIGRKSAEEIENKLQRMGIQLRDER